MPFQPHLHPQLLLQPVGCQMLYDVERLALAVGGGELDRPHIPRNLQSRLVQHSAPLSDPHQRRTIVRRTFSDSVPIVSAMRSTWARKNSSLGAFLPENFDAS